MGIAARTICPSNDSGQYASTGVRGEGANQMSDQVIGFCNVVIRINFVIPNQKFVNVLCSPNEKVTSIFGDDEILGEDLQYLFVMF